MRKTVLKISFFILFILSLFSFIGCGDIFSFNNDETLKITSSTFTVSRDNLYQKVSNSKTTFSFADNITLQDGSTFMLYNNSQKTQELSKYSVSLTEGDNNFYLVVSNGAKEKGYTATVRRREMYQVTFNETGVPAQTVEEDGYATLPSVTPTKAGYTFNGWNFNFESTKITRDTVINSKAWLANTYAVIFDGNGGTGEMQSQTFTYDVSQRLRKNSFTKAGYTFVGWSYNQNEYTDQESVKNLTDKSEEITLKAVWEAKSYLLTLNTSTNDAGVLSGTGTYKFGSLVTITATANNGYEFIGWFDENGLLLTNESDGVTPSLEYTFNMPAKNTTITARWNDSSDHEHTYFADNNALCTICYKLDLTKCGSRYGYTALSSLANGQKMQQMYLEVDAKMVEFFNNTTLDVPLDANDRRIIVTVSYADYGLSEEEALSVWSTFRNDNPQYYFISRSVVYSATRIMFMIDNEYALAQTRNEINAQIIRGVQDYIVLETSSYLTALALHDEIVDNMEYAYTADGTTPETAVWAHNIVGYFTDGEGVCETYAKVYQFFLNIYGIDNIFVTGFAGGDRHAWNLVQLDDDNWYWCDLTWDDTVYFWGIDYDYFLVVDSETDYNGASFISSHTPIESTLGLEYMCILPTRAVNPYDDDDLNVNETFTVDGYTYEVVGYEVVELKSIPSGLSSLEIFETVTYNGTTYTIISIGKNSGNTYSSVVNSGVKSITIYTTLRNIDPYAFYYATSLKNIYYQGTEAQWQQVIKGQGWVMNTYQVTINFVTQ